MNEAAIEVQESDSLHLVQPLGEALFDHHLSISAAGLPTIPRESSWSLRRKHCEELFAEKPNAALWLATFNGKAVDLRELLQAEGFLLSTERLVHTV